MTFNDFKYVRPDMDDFQARFKATMEVLTNATTANEQIEQIDAINTLRNDFESSVALVRIRHSIDTIDVFYNEENDFFDENMPIYTSMVDQYYRALNTSPFKNELMAHYGEHFFNIIDVQLRTFNPEIMEDMKLENQLVSQYTKFKASAKINFDGKELNLSQMSPYYESKDRMIRKAAQMAVTAFYEENEVTFDKIYDDLVKVRHQIAKKLGFENFTELGYYRLTRTDYGPKEVATYRDQVLKSLVPITSKLRARQQKRLGLDQLHYYDEQIAFNSGNATPKGDSAWIVERGIKMYDELSEETGTFMHFMIDKKLTDLEAKKGKAGGGYCSFIANEKAPFIFSNFNGTSGDVDVLTHEAGHAFQVFQSRNYNIPEYVWPTLEACEIHSMSMEFFTWPWMKSFFLDEEMKYKFNHLSEALLFIPYGVTVDEFQHFVYANPDVTPEERKTKWREIEKKYLPTRSYEENDFLERGGYWFKQGHIFCDPFYYIDYTLAQVCAFQFWAKSLENREAAWSSYVELCNTGGSLPFVKLVEVAGLNNPFEEGSIDAVVPTLTAWLDSIDDTVL